MLKSLWRPLAVAVLALALVAAGGSAVVAKTKKASNKATITLKSPVKFKRNKFIQDGSRYIPGDVAIKSGGTLTLRNKSSQPHSFSVVAAKDVPKTLKAVDNCGSPGTPCDTFFTAHVPDADGNPTKPVVEAGAAGIDTVGDSVILNPKQTLKLKVSAPKGKTLNFMCVIHSWMSGKLKVR
jgi:hypothetical protein